MSNTPNSTNNDFYIESEIERLNYLIIAGEENANCFVSVCGEQKEQLYGFEATLVLDEDDDVEVVSKSSPTVDITMIKTNSVIKVVYEYDGIRTDAECFIRHARFEDNQVVLSISGPYKMHRSQKRNASRVVLSKGLEAKVCLDAAKEFLTDLSVINISPGGVALLVNAPVEYLKTNMVYESAKIDLPLKFNNQFSTQMKICHVKAVDKDSLPLYLQEKAIGDGWLQVGIKFTSINAKLEHSLIMVVNQGLRNDN